jgi:serine O-acetyltransferase
MEATLSGVNFLVRAQRLPGLGFVAKQLLGIMGTEIPSEVSIDPTVKFVHRGAGTVLHPRTTIGRNVTFYHRVTVARSNSWEPDPFAARVRIEDWTVLCPGAVVLFDHREVRVAQGTVVAANSVLTQSTGEWEIWAGAPARKVGLRRDRPNRPR